ncbi:MAG: ACP S-malonyltransferase, partial [Proteobacteria bacterium]|nr:ACP S-malonyltransferase [Pseudomonadota bacterium]
MNKSNIALVFPGQGSQIVGMGKDLYDNFAVAKEVFDEVDNILGLKLSQIMFEGPKEDLTKTENTQPALMAVSVAIIRVLEKEFGKKVEDICSFVAGHSLGEYSALCAARAITLEQTAKLLQIRGGAMARCGQKSSGAMAAILGVDIDVASDIAKSAIQGDEVCQVANDNSVGQIVISGSKTAIDRAIAIAKERGIRKAIPLPVSGAFHSALMKEAAIEMQEALSDINISNPIVPVIANVTADIADSSKIKELLVKQITGSVRWRETMLFMENKGIKEVIEIGSGKVL